MDRPIIFSGEMVRAILLGNKTQTRRVIKPQPYREGVWWKVETKKPVSECTIYQCNMSADMTEHLKHLSCPYDDDELWVRETWNVLNSDGCSPRDITPQPHRVVYRADGDGQYPFWRPSIFMPRWASRIQLKITNVRVERLQDISNEDACAEGVGWWGCDTVEVFADLWDWINAKRGYSFASNPWCWCIEFERIK